MSDFKHPPPHPAGQKNTKKKNKNINHGSIKPSRDLLKNEKEESYVNTTE